MTLKPGSVTDFANSMAEAIEQAFKSEWQRMKRTPLLEAGEEDRKILFSAIAQGVVRHLKEKVGNAFKIHVCVTQTNEVMMKSDNPDPISMTNAATIQSGHADVKQLDNAGNMVISKGDGTIVEVLTDG